ncbi:MAG: homocysteine S-methyltransferase family protein [Bacillaceae bacterium]|nr:homocysteine S-methyltransferase family protein [Bacillaceae bacterium]
MSFLHEMKNQTLIGDGAIGTYLYLQGVNRCFEELNLTEREKVKQVHHAYVEAGAQLIQTNTYAANSIKLKRYGLEEKVAIINQSAVEIAKEAVATTPNTYVVGTLGGIRGFQKGAYSLDEITYSFETQLDSLLGSKVDGILLETFYDFDEIKACLELVKAKTDLPVISHVSLDEVGVLHGGVKLGDALTQLADLGSDVVGFNCRMGPFHMSKSLEEIPLINGTYLSVYPNASLPDYIDGRLVYQSNPEYFGASAYDFHQQGVNLIGGCCGTTPAHIKSIAEAVKGKAPILKKEVKKDKTKIVIDLKNKIQPISELVMETKSVIVELDPPKKLNIHDFLEGSKNLRKSESMRLH